MSITTTCAHAMSITTSCVRAYCVRAYCVCECAPELVTFNTPSQATGALHRPKLLRSSANCSLGNGFVKISATIFFNSQCCKIIMPLLTKSLVKWYFRPMCFVHGWCTGFTAI